MGFSVLCLHIKKQLVVISTKPRGKRLPPCIYTGAVWHKELLSKRKRIYHAELFSFVSRVEDLTVDPKKGEKKPKQIKNTFSTSNFRYRYRILFNEMKLMCKICPYAKLYNQQEFFNCFERSQERILHLSVYKWHCNYEHEVEMWKIEVFKWTLRS